MSDKIKTFGLYLLKTPSSDESFLYCLIRAIIIFSLFFFILLPLVFFISMLLLNYSWLINLVVFGGGVIGFSSLLLGIISEKMWIISKWAFLTLVLFWVWAVLLPISFCFVSWWDVSLISTRIQIPLYGANGIAIDNENNIYVSIAFCQRVQVYNHKGEFLRSWSAKIGKEGTDYNFVVDKDNKLHVFDKYYHNVYNVIGNSFLFNEDSECLKNDDPRQAMDSFGNLYEFPAKNEEEDFHSLYSMVVKTTPEGQKSVAISDPQPIKLIRQLPALGCAMLSGIFLSLAHFLLNGAKHLMLN